MALDIDGVLLDPHPRGRGSWQDALQRRYAVRPTDLVDVFFGPHWTSIVTGREPLRPILEEALNKLDWPMKAGELIDFWFEADYHVDHEVLSAVHGWHRDGARIVLMTNQEPTRARFLWNRLSKLAPIEAMVFSGEVGVTKDRPGFFESASRMLKVSDQTHVVFVDDDSANVRAARAHGWWGIHYRRGPKDLGRVAKALSAYAELAGSPARAVCASE